MISLRLRSSDTSPEMIVGAGWRQPAVALYIAWLYSAAWPLAEAARRPGDAAGLEIDGGAARSPGRAVLLPKRGTGWGLNATLVHTLAGLRWWYDWGPSVGDPAAMAAAAAEGMHFVPMQWGRWGIDRLAEQLEPGAERVILGPNEPNHQLQANLTPKEAAVRAAAVAGCRVLCCCHPPVCASTFSTTCCDCRRCGRSCRRWQTSGVCCWAPLPPRRAAPDASRPALLPVSRGS